MIIVIRIIRIIIRINNINNYIYLAWRIQERDKINNSNYPEPIRLAALANLLDQEAILIQKIDKLKQDANMANHERNINNLLNEVIFIYCHYLILI